MRRRFALFGLLSATLFSQGSGISVVGAIEAVSDGEIRLKTGEGTVRIYTDSKTEVSKGKVTRDLSLLKPGNEVSVRSEVNPSGKPVASRIWASVVDFSGVVLRVNPGDLLVSSSRLGNRIVRFYPSTASFASPREIVEGQEVYVVGLDIGDATVDAVRLTVYDTDAPVKN